MKEKMDYFWLGRYEVIVCLQALPAKDEILIDPGSMSGTWFRITKKDGKQF